MKYNKKIEDKADEILLFTIIALLAFIPISTIFISSIIGEAAILYLIYMVFVGMWAIPLAVRSIYIDVKLKGLGK